MVGGFLVCRRVARFAPCAWGGCRGLPRSTRRDGRLPRGPWRRSGLLALRDLTQTVRGNALLHFCGISCYEHLLKILSSPLQIMLRQCLIP
jgi:hypothetical protein